VRSSILFFIFIFGFSFSLWAQKIAVPGSRKGKLISQAVAQVSQHVITSREVSISYMIDQALAHKKGLPLDRASWVLKENSEDFQKHLTQVLLESVVQLEAENFSVGEVSVEEIQKQVKAVDELVKGWAPWQAFDVAASEQEMMVSRKLRAKNFLKFKVETSGVQISDDEAKAFYEKNRVKFGNLPFSQFKDGIKEVLAEEQMQERLKDWFDILKRKYRVKFLGQST
jgi:hypothetical protein